MKHLELLIERYPALAVCECEIKRAIEAIIACYEKGGKLLLCGNGGSCADCDHIVGELMKGFLKKRPLSSDERADIPEKVADKLQGGIKAIPLTSLSSLSTAFANDVDAELVYAQLVSVFGGKNDVFFGISTSGNAENVCIAATVAKAREMKTVALTGKDGGRLAKLCDVAIIAPESETYKIQELHLPIYHAVCAQVEEELFD